MSVTLICGDGTPMPVQKGFASKMSLFQKPEYADVRSYELKCKARPDVLAPVIRLVYGDDPQVDLNEANIRELRSLCEELGFSGLERDFRAFETAKREVKGDSKNPDLKELDNDLYRHLISITKLVFSHHAMFMRLVHGCPTRKEFRVLEEQVQERLRGLNEAAARQDAQVHDLRSRVERLEAELRQGEKDRHRKISQNTDHKHNEMARQEHGNQETKSAKRQKEAEELGLKQAKRPARESRCNAWNPADSDEELRSDAKPMTPPKQESVKIAEQQGESEQKATAVSNVRSKIAIFERNAPKEEQRKVESASKAQPQAEPEKELRSDAKPMTPPQQERVKILTRN